MVAVVAGALTVDPEEADGLADVLGLPTEADVDADVEDPLMAVVVVWLLWVSAVK